MPALRCACSESRWKSSTHGLRNVTTVRSPTTRIVACAAAAAAVHKAAAASTTVKDVTRVLRRPRLFHEFIGHGFCINKRICY